MEPDKFKNVTNGVDHRRWLSQVNPVWTRFDPELIGRRVTHSPMRALAELDQYAEDGAVLPQLEDIKRRNKLTFARWAHRQQGMS